MKDYKDTLLMMQTDFPMRGNLGVNEPNIQAYWEEHQIYQKALDQNKGKEAFFLHDGPPYANGNIHVGHGLNKVLKDFIVRYETLNGKYAPLIPGWDTHGLPIENALTKNKKVNRKEMSVSAFRSLCEQYALEQVEIQKKGFKRLGVFADWDHPYITLQHQMEAEQLRLFGQMAKNGLIFKGLKPVYWSPSSETALAEAEIEYYDVTSASIYVAFTVIDGKGLLNPGDELLIWTTTPWTLPANLAICANSDFEYGKVKVGNRMFVVALGLLDATAKTCGWENYEIVKTFKGSDLEYITYKHVYLDREGIVILGDHVTLESGTGLVHTATGHGEDDFIVGRKYHLDVLCPVDAKGYMMEETGKYSGLFYATANEEIAKDLMESGKIIKRIDITHSYPHDWRTKKPIIFRATAQWFASIEPIKSDILKAIDEVNWYPAWGKIRMNNMIEGRGDWCISRQRVWGVPIPVFYCEDGSAILDATVINHVADIVEEHGTNAWFDFDSKDLLPDGYTNPGSPNGKFIKETDIMDVWFDSGSTHQSVMNKRLGAKTSDVYIEGSDQYRGWFNSSLITSVALNGHAPYKNVISHGWTLDGNGQKMSKSLGNTIDPVQVCNELGADIYRLWVAGVDYQADVRISKDLLKQTSESYRKIRNTYRFLLGNLFDFDPNKNLVDYANLGEIDQYILTKLNHVIKDSHHGFKSYRFDEVYRSVLNFMTNELSSFYLDFTKDILYIEKADSLNRRRIQSVFYHVLKALLVIMTPILPHTTEEVYQYLNDVDKKESIYLLVYPAVNPEWDNEPLEHRFDEFMKVRDDILKVLETARNDKVIGKSMNALVTLAPTDKVKDLFGSIDINYPQVLAISKLVIDENLTDGIETPIGKVKVELAQGETCSRCWQIVDEIGEDELCHRCHHILND